MSAACPVCKFWWPFCRCRMAETVAAQEASERRDVVLERLVRRRTPEETLNFIGEMCEHTASVEALSDIQLVGCLREEITDQMPMNSRDFCLIAEAEDRLLKYAAAGKPPNVSLSDQGSAP